MDFFHINQKLKPKKGDLLLSEPYLPDPNFDRTVILICEHDENGTIGYVLNKPSVHTFEEVIEGVDNFDETLYLGGPVQQNTLHFIHRSIQLSNDSKQLGKELYWGQDFDELITIIENKIIAPQDFRFFMGYSGWSEGQLEEELDSKSWIVHRLNDTTILFDTPPEILWKTIMAQLGAKYKMMSNYPTDPNMN